MACTHPLPAVRRITALLVLLLLFPSISALGASVPVNTFSVQAVIPENQLNKKKSYFDLRLEPGQEQTLQLRVTNSHPQPIQVQTAVNPASTGRNGVVVYHQKSDGAIAQAVQVVQPQLELAPQETAMVELRVTMPQQPLDGVLLGGVVVSAQAAQSGEDTGSSQDIRLENDYAYVVGLRLSQNDTPVEPDFALGSVSPALINYRTAVVMELENLQPLLASNMAVSAQVFRENDSEPYRQLDLQQAEMAPSSTGDFVIDWGSAPLEAGTYRLRAQADYQDRTWVWEDQFVIQSDAAKEINTGAVDVSGSRTTSIVIALLLLLIVGLLLFWLGRRSARRGNADRDII